MRRPALALALLSLAVIVAAVLTIGGPEQARAERRDAQRMTDLHTLGRHLTCLLDQELELGDTSDTCPPPPQVADPKTSDPYQITRTSHVIFRVCANFERPTHAETLTYRADFDREAGCLVLRRTQSRP